MQEYDRRRDGDYDLDDMDIYLSHDKVESVIAAVRCPDDKSRDALQVIRECEKMKRLCIEGAIDNTVFVEKCRAIQKAFRDKHHVWCFQTPAGQQFYEQI